MYCNFCGAENPNGSKFCSSCGKELAPTTNATATSIQENIPVVSARSEQVEVKKKIKKPIYKRVWFWVLIVIVLLFLFGSSSDSKNDKKSKSHEIVNEGENIGISSEIYKEPVKSEKKNAEDVSKQIAIEAVPTLDGQMAVFITNNSDTIIDELELKLNYVDENEMVIDQATDGHDVILPGYTVVSQMDIPSVPFTDVQIEYNIELGVHKSYKNHSEDVDMEYNPGAGCVMVSITNNGAVEIDEVEIDVVLYKGDDIVLITYPKDIYHLGAGQSTTEKIDVYSFVTYNNLEYGTDYDRIDVYLNQAHTFGL